MAKKDGKEKFFAKGGPFHGEALWLCTDSTLEFTIMQCQGYYTTRHNIANVDAVWVDTKPKVQPTFNFESRENINGFSNGL